MPAWQLSDVISKLRKCAKVLNWKPNPKSVSLLYCKYCKRKKLKIIIIKQRPMSFEFTSSSSVCDFREQKIFVNRDCGQHRIARICKLASLRSTGKRPERSQQSTTKHPNSLTLFQRIRTSRLRGEMKLAPCSGNSDHLQPFHRLLRTLFFSTPPLVLFFIALRFQDEPRKDWPWKIDKRAAHEALRQIVC